MSQGMDAPVEVTPAQAAPGPAAPVFFAVSPSKMLLMSIATFGLYDIYWFYKNWMLVKEREKTDISPAWRALFSILWCYPMLHRMHEQAKALRVSMLSPVGLTVLYVILNFAGRAPDPYAAVVFLAPLTLIPAQVTAMQINRRLAPGHDENARYSVGNTATVIIGGLLFVLALIGILMKPAIDEMAAQGAPHAHHQKATM